MKRLVALTLACLSIGAAPGAPRSIPIRRAWPLPPLDAIVPGALLLRGEGEVEGARVSRVMADGTRVLRLDGARDDLAGARATIARRDELLALGLDVELDLYRQAQAGPDDEGYSKQWALSLIKALDAWKVHTGDPDLTVAVVDTGYVDHPDLLPRIAPGYDFISDPANAGDGDGRDADPHDVGDESEASSSFHGSHVSGIIGAASNNAIGMAGVDWNCRLQPVRVLGIKRHRGRDSDIADGIRWAAGLNVPGVPQNKTPARIINLSFGGPGYSQALQDAVRAAHARGVLLIGSAGNAAEEASNNVPGALEGVTSIAAAGPDGTLASYSNFGERVDFMAPGGALFLEAPTDSDTPGAIWSTSFVRAASQPVFAFAAGTSQAAAHATGIAALVRGAAPSLPPDVVAAVMRRASRLPAAGCPQGCGAGLIDASLAVRYARMIEEASCGEGSCGATNVLAPAPLRPEEGCSVAAPGRAAGDAGRAGGLVFAVLGALALRARRRDSSPRGWACACALLVGCNANADDDPRERDVPAPIVKVVDPIPTYENGDLLVRIGAGREIEVSVTPAGSLDRVELRVDDVGQTIGRLGHAPFRFFVPSWVFGEAGKRLLCVSAIDARAQTGETCFYAVE